MRFSSKQNATDIVIEDKHIGILPVRVRRIELHDKWRANKTRNFFNGLSKLSPRAELDRQSEIAIKTSLLYNDVNLHKLLAAQSLGADSAPPPLPPRPRSNPAAVFTYSSHTKLEGSTTHILFYCQT